MPAFIATVEGDEGRVGDVYFVPQAIHARRAVCDYWQDGELSGAEVRRAPHLDQYEEQGWVPISDMVYEGWWAECDHCGIKLTADEQYDDDDNEFVLNPDDFTGVFNGWTFCCQSCEDTFRLRRDMERDMRLKMLDMMQAKLESKFGADGLVFTEDKDGYRNGYHATVAWNGDTPFIKQASLHFKVPGCQYGLHYDVQDEKGTGDPTYSVSYNPHDHDAVAAFFKERTGRTLDKPESVA